MGYDVAEYDKDMYLAVIAHCPIHGNYIYTGVYIPGIAMKRCPKCPHGPWIPGPDAIKAYREAADACLG